MLKQNPQIFTATLFLPPGSMPPDWKAERQAPTRSRGVQAERTHLRNYIHRERLELYLVKRMKFKTVPQTVGAHVSGLGRLMPVH